MDTLTEIVKREVERYATPSFNSQTFAVSDDKRKIYAVLSVLNKHTDDRVAPVVVARVVNDSVLIEADMTNKPLLDALTQAGIPRSKIILAYDNEQSSNTAHEGHSKG
jgi:hypothetical protein